VHSGTNVNSRSSGQEIPHLLWKPKVYYRPYPEPHGSSSHPPPLISIRSIPILSFHLRIGLSNVSYLQDFRIKSCMHFICLLCVLQKELYKIHLFPLAHPWLSYSLQQSPSWEADTCSVAQDIPRLLKNPKVQCRVLKILPSAPTRSSKWSLPLTFSDQNFIHISI
jgi:hypothetical protein